MSSSHIREALAELGQDVAELQLSPPHAIRARGESRRRRRVVGAIAAVAVGAAVTGAVALPLLRSASAAGRSLSPGAAATASTQPPASGGREPAPYPDGGHRGRVHQPRAGVP